MIFVATGEGNGSDSYYGQGIFKSADLGANWTQLAPGIFDRVAFTRLAIDSNNPPHLFAAVTGANSLTRTDSFFLETNPASQGLWKSTDGGNTWSQYSSTVTFGCGTTGTPCAADDVVIDPGNSNIVFAAIDTGNVFRSSDGGNTWQGMTFPGIPSGPNQMGRQSLAISPTSPGTVYAMIGASPTREPTPGFFDLQTSERKLDRRHCAPTFRVDVGSGVTLDGTSGSFSQSGYDQALAVMPDNPATVYFGGVAPYISKNSGTSWSFIADSGILGTSPSTHSDQHAVAVDPFDSNFLYIGNDGGFFSYDRKKGVWTPLSFGFSAGQIQGIGPHPSDNARLIAGFQDNTGTQIYSGSQEMAPRRGYPVSSFELVG